MYCCSGHVILSIHWAQVTVTYTRVGIQIQTRQKTLLYYFGVGVQVYTNTNPYIHQNNMRKTSQGNFSIEKYFKGNRQPIFLLWDITQSLGSFLDKKGWVKYGKISP